MTIHQVFLVASEGMIAKSDWQRQIVNQAIHNLDPLRRDKFNRLLFDVALKLICWNNRSSHE